MANNNAEFVVYGYIRNNYKHNVPDAIIKMCWMYFEQILAIHYKGKRFDHLMSCDGETPEGAM